MPADQTVIFGALKLLMKSVETLTCLNSIMRYEPSFFFVFVTDVSRGNIKNKHLAALLCVKTKKGVILKPAGVQSKL